jgi:hypothetical protein
MSTLTQPELQKLTGYKIRARQADWLRANGVPYRADSAGRLIVLATHLERWVSGAELRPSTAPLLDLVR